MVRLWDVAIGFGVGLGCGSLVAYWLTPLFFRLIGTPKTMVTVLGISGSAVFGFVAGVHLSHWASGLQNIAAGAAIQKRDITSLTVDEAVKALVPGYAQYLAPNKLGIGQTGKVRLELGPSVLSLSDLVALQKSTGGEITQARVQIGPLMRAQLAGSEFEISPKDPVDQWVAATDPTVWEWSITPQAGNDWFPARSTQREVDLTLSAVLKIDGTEHTRAITTYRRSIEIEVAWSNWVHQGVEKAKDFWWLGGIVLGIVGYAVGKRRGHPLDDAI